MDERQLIDPQRMLWRDDVEGICTTIDMCFEYGEHVRCGPCAIKQSIARGVEPDLTTIPNLPEVSRLTRENKRLQGELTARSPVIDEMVEAWADVIAERKRQLDAEGRSHAHDDKYEREELARAAACYAAGVQLVDEANGRVWPWSDDWWGPSFPINRRRELVKAGALILAEIERIDRAALTAALGGPHG